MKRLLSILASLILYFNGFCQTVIYSDNMESSGWTWKGVPRLLLNSTFTGGFSSATDFPANSVLYTSIDSSFAVFGTGLGSSATERDTLSYLNVTGLNPNVYYQIRFRICSIGINPGTNAAAGVDGSDFVQIDYSSNGGTTFLRELKFVGASNSAWSFNGGIQVSKVANGSLTTFSYNAGSPTTTLGLNLPVGITQLAFNIIMVVNASGETWFIDDVQLVAITALPVELLSFEAERQDQNSLLTWATASETNNDYFSVYSSFDAFDFELIGTVLGSGNSNFMNRYSYVDRRKLYGVVYYKLCQTDFDGNYECFGPIALNLGIRDSKRIVKIVNILGQDVDEDFEGYKLIIYEDGSVERSY